MYIFVILHNMSVNVLKIKSQEFLPASIGKEFLLPLRVPLLPILPLYS